MPNKKVFVSGCYDLLHSGHVEFFRQASQYGDLYVGIGSDATILEYKHHKTVYSEQERLFMVKSIRYVKDAFINAGSGVMDFVPTVEALKPDEEVTALITDCVHVMGENTQLARVAFVEATGVCSYIHMGGKIGVLMKFDVEGIDPTADAFVAYGRDVAMQVAAMSPVAPNREAVPADIVAKEMEIYKAQAAQSGKPENIQEKIATGRLEKFYAENCLTEQAFVKDGDLTIQQYTDKVAKELGGSIKVVDFVRYALGE